MGAVAHVTKQRDLNEDIARIAAAVPDGFYATFLSPRTETVLSVVSVLGLGTSFAGVVKGKRGLILAGMGVSLASSLGLFANAQVRRMVRL